ncbi:MAG: phenylalanine--tRNA ligase subunit beta [Ruminococcaceae bacterium]|mgnify:CR=1 FL=1|nr:phenylalanine--tRNA ligase subunit beta [Oscillospiraceae bacterium]
MLAPLDWIEEYIEFKPDIDDFSHRMTMIGQKVEGYRRESDEIINVFVGKILNLDNHPNADRLLYGKVDVGNKELQFVTGAKNTAVGDLVPVAVDGALLHGGIKIKSGELRGVASECMLCSAKELGFSKSDYPDAAEDGIMILPDTAVPGTDIADFLKLNVPVFEFEITPNRPDCNSILGLSREASVAFNCNFVQEKPKAPVGTGNIKDILSVEKPSENCLRYSASAIKNVKIKPSPEWMRARLRRSGIRPINNIVDITNYVMLEYGQPMHAFDLRHVEGQKIIVRQAVKGEKITTLDGVERILDETDMVIADMVNPSAVAGIMGGETSGVYDDTDTVIFESAVFKPESVRVTSKKLGLRTDSSMRFEKGVDSKTTVEALCRAMELVEMLGAGEAVDGIIDINTDDYTSPAIELDVKRINKILGTSLTEEFMIMTLLKLGFSVDNNKFVTPPSYRRDVKVLEDLSEEVARVYGYDNIPYSLMEGVALAKTGDLDIFRRGLKQLATGLGLYEAMTMSFMGTQTLDNLNAAADSKLRNAVRISNPLGEETAFMKTTLLGTLMESLSKNFASRQKSVALFELNKIYLPLDNDPLAHEPEMFSVAAYGDFDFFKLKGIVEAVMDYANINDVDYLPVSDNPTFHPGRTAKVVYKGEVLGIFGELHPDVPGNFQIKSRCFVAEISVEKLFALRGPDPAFDPLPRFPAVTRDLALVVDKEVPSADIIKTIEKNGRGLLEKISLFDVYQSKELGDDTKSMAYNLIFRSSDRTLTDKEVDGVIAEILQALNKENIRLRG